MKKGDISIISDVTFLIILFFASMALLFVLSIIRFFAGPAISVTVIGSFMEFTLNTENMLLSSSEVTLDASCDFVAGGVPFKKIMNAAALQWSGDAAWHKKVYFEGNFYNISMCAKKILDWYGIGNYVLELRRTFSAGQKSIVIATNTATPDDLGLDPRVAEMQFKTSFTCAGCDTASFRLYSTLTEGAVMGGAT